MMTANSSITAAMSANGSSFRLAIRQQAEVIVAKRRTRELALQIGFTQTKAGELSVVATELATNLIKHAGGGEFSAAQVTDDVHEGIEIATHDRGPGISNPHRVLVDGYTTAGSLGIGLGMVNRIMDELDITSPLVGGQGCHISARRWLLTTGQIGKGICGLDIGVASRPHPLMRENGDGYFIHKWGDSLLVALIDGLGHGHAAWKATQNVINYLGEHFESDLESLFQGAHRACLPTRGAVMAILRFDCQERRVHHGSVGNIESRLWSGQDMIHFPVRRGVVGATLPRLHITHTQYAPGDVLALFSDGLSSHWDWRNYPHLHSISANDAAKELLNQHQRTTDDASIVIIKAGAL